MLKARATCIIIITALALVIAGPVFSSSIETEHFKIRSSGGDIPKDKLINTGNRLETAYSDISSALGLDLYKKSKIETNVYKDSRRRGYVTGATIHVDANFNDMRVLKHAVTLIMIHKAMPNSSLWFSQGMAKYISSGDIRDSRDQGSYVSSKDFSFAKLESNFHKGKTENSAYIAAWAIVSYLADTYGSDKLKKIFKENGSFSNKFQKAFGVKLKDLEPKAKEIFNTYRPDAR